MSGFKLDHAGIAVKHLGQAREIFSCLGFNLTDLSIHSGKAGPDGKAQPLGSGNHCAMFRSGYIELIGVVDPKLPSSVAPFLASHSGGFILSFSTEDADVAYGQATRTAQSAQSPVLLQREVMDEAGNAATAGFRNVIVGSDFPEVRLLFTQHLTPDLLWQERHMAHPNGATGLKKVRFAVEKPMDVAGRYSRLVGVLPEKRGDDAVLRCDGQEIIFSPLEALSGRPSFVGATIGVGNLNETSRYFETQGVPFTHASRTELMVSSEHACGFTLTFENREQTP